jgi:hypothetical protein
MKTRVALLIVAALMVITPAVPAFAGPKPTEPVLPLGSRVVSSGQVTVSVNGSPEILNYQVYQRSGTSLISDGLGPTGGATTASTSEYLCGISVTDRWGGWIGTLEQHVWASFSSTPPIGWNLSSGSTTTSAAWWCCSWDNVTNPPYANLGYGSTHLSNGTKANGDLYYFGSPSGWHTVEEFWTNYPISPGWSCSGGPGRISIP